MLRLVFAYRGFVLVMTMEIEASAVMLTSCVPLKEVLSCPFSSFLGMLSVSKLFNEAHDMRPDKKQEKVLPVPREHNKGWDLTKLKCFKITQRIFYAFLAIITTFSSKIYICKSCDVLLFII